MSSLKDATQGNPNDQIGNQPIWLPFVRAFILLQINIPGLFLISFFGLGSIFLLTVENAVLSIIFLGFLIIFSAISVFSIFYFITRLLFGKWIPRWSSFWEGSYALFVMIVSSLMSFIGILIQGKIMCSFFFDTAYSSGFCVGSYLGYLAIKMLENPAQPASILAISVWFISATILYIIEYEVRRIIHPKTLSRLIFMSLIIGFISSGIITFQGEDVQYLSDSSLASEISSSEDESSTLEEEYSDLWDTIAEHDASYDDVYDDVEYDTFNDALNAGMEAAMLAQTAKSSQEWNKVSETWKEAIELLEYVPESSPNLETAQNKIEEYQKNLNYSQRQANQNAQYEALIPPDLNFKKGLEEASSAAFFVQTAKSKPEWEFVATQWQNAIVYMKQVQPSDTNYKAAQERVVQYQKNLEYARLAGSQAKE
jgi:uncharacterized protein YlxW (UPF0749 family)